MADRGSLQACEDCVAGALQLSSFNSVTQRLHFSSVTQTAMRTDRLELAARLFSHAVSHVSR